MNYGNKAKTNFKKLSKKFQKLQNQDMVTKLDIAKLCNLCKSFEDSFLKWQKEAKKYGENSLKAISLYDEYVKSTPINELLRVSYGRRFKYITKFFAENKDSQVLCEHSNIKETCPLCLKLKMQTKKRR